MYARHPQFLQFHMGIFWEVRYSPKIKGSRSRIITEIAVNTAFFQSWEFYGTQYDLSLGCARVRGCWKEEKRYVSKQYRIEARTVS